MKDHIIEHSAVSNGVHNPARHSNNGRELNVYDDIKKWWKDGGQCVSKFTPKIKRNGACLKN